MIKSQNILLVLVTLFFTLSCGKDEKEINSIKDAETAIIGVMTGSTGEEQAKEKFPNADIKRFDDFMDAVAALRAGQVDVVLTAESNAINICKNNTEIKLLKDTIEIENIAIAINKSKKQLLDQINEILRELESDGTLKEMSKRWFNQNANYEPVDIKVFGKGIPLKVGVTASLEPFCFVDSKQTIAGHDVELAKRIADKLGRPVQFVDMKFSALILALQSGKIDMILTGMTATKERMKYVNFSEPYFVIPQMLIAKKSDKELMAESEKIRSTEDIKTKKFGIILGAFNEYYVKEKFPQAELLYFKSPSDLLVAVKTGKIDVGFYTHETLLAIFREDPDFGFLEESVLRVPMGIGFNKNNGALREQFNAFLKEIKSNGTYQDMKERWINKGILEMPEIPNPENNGVIVMGTVSDKGLPFTTVKNNKMIGFDTELAERFAAYLGKKLEFADMEFGNLIAAVSTNKIDAIVSTLVITEERKKQIDFSDPYMELGTSIFGLKKNLAKYDNELKHGSSQGISVFDNIERSFYNNIIVEERYLLILDGLKTTLVISLLTTIFGTLLGGLVCLMRMSKNKIVQSIARIYISVLRGTPVLVVLMIIFYVVFASVNIDPVIVAVVAFGLNFAAYVSEMFRTGIEGVDSGQSEAGIALGFTKVKTFLYIILPQAIRRIMPVYKGELISLVKMTSIVGYIAVQDLTKASDIIRSRTFDAFFPLIFVAVLYFVIAWLLLAILGYLEKVTDPKLKSIKLRGQNK